MNNEIWICIRSDERGLITADLKDGTLTIKTLGGSYPKTQSAELDARKTWGYNLPVHGFGYNPNENNDSCQ